MKVKSILGYFPDKIEQALFMEVNENFEKLEEIRLRVLRPIILKLREEEKIVKYDVSQEDILNTLAHICEDSIYSYQNEIASRFCDSKRRP